MKTNTLIQFASLGLFGLSALTGYAVVPTNTVDIGMPLAVDFGGTTKTDGWYNLSSAPKNRVVQYESLSLPGNSGYPSFFQSTQPWPSPIDSQVYSSGTSTAYLSKSANGAAGGPYPAGDSIYFAGFGTEPNTFDGSLTVTESAPIADLSTVMFQVEFGEAYTYDFYDDPVDGLALPALTLFYGDSETITLSGVFQEKVMSLYNGTVDMPTGPEGEMVPEDIFINLWAFQYDVSGYEDITSFSLEFSGAEHAQLYAMQLDQSDIAYGGTSMVPVPEPSSVSLGLGLAVLTLVSVHQRRKVSTR